MKKLLLAVLLLTGMGYGQTAVLSPPPKLCFLGNDGAPAVGGKLYSYTAGTSSLLTTYADSSGSASNANPLILDGLGCGTVFLANASAYKFVIADSSDVTIYTVDNIAVTGPGRFTTITASGASTLAAVTATTISASGVITSTVSTGTAPLTVASTTKVTNLNADQLDGNDWAIPGTIGSTTPNTGSFTTLATSSDLTTTGADKCHILTTANGASLKQCSISEAITLSTSGATTDSTADLLPATSLIEGVACRVTTTITTATDWAIGDSSTAARLCAANSTMTAGTTCASNGTAWTTGIASATTGMKQTAAAKLRVTTTGTPGAGAIRCTVFYLQTVAPTS